MFVVINRDDNVRCQIQYFAKFGGFMFLTIGLSFLFCYFFFMPLMLVWGALIDEM